MDLMEQAQRQAEAFHQHGNIFIVGVAGVGKSSMGRLAAEALEMKFLDIERIFYNEYAAKHDGLIRSIGTLDRLHGRETVDSSLMSLTKRTLKNLKNHLLVTSTRCLRLPHFWDWIHAKGISIHLHGMPGEIYERRCQRNMRMYSKKFKKKPLHGSVHLKRLYHPVRKIYFHWDELRKSSLAMQANYQLRIRGENDRDLEDLCVKILAIKKHLRNGGLPTLPIREDGLGFHPDPTRAISPSDLMKMPLPPGLHKPSEYKLPDLR